MKSNTYVILAVLMLMACLNACSSVRQESALEWMQRQPWDTLQ
jgi:hypothetical protein